jgi:hypothetical protein
MGFANTFSRVGRNLFAQFVRTLRPPGKGPPREWCVRLEEMKRCRKVSELVDRFGQPAHTVQTGNLEILHYPLGITGGLLYAAHAVSSQGAVSQVYMHMEPSYDGKI